MADQSDVEKALVTLIASALYPNGVPADPTQSAISVATRVERGWPAQKQLDEDLGNGILNISVFPRPNMERNTTRFEPRWEERPIPAPTYGATILGQTITITGAAPNPYVAQNLAAYVDGMAYVVQAQAGWTAAQVAAALYTQIQLGEPAATVSGAVITLPASARLGEVVIGTTGSASQEVGRQEKHFQIVFWSPTPDIRDAAVSLVDPVLRANYRLALADGSAATMKYAGSVTNDAPQKELLFRRDLFFSVEYATTLTISAPQLVALEVDVTDPFGNLISAGRVAYDGMLDLSQPGDAAVNTVI